jgi:hypothetical protein
LKEAGNDKRTSLLQVGIKNTAADDSEIDLSCIKLQPCILENSKEEAVSEKRDNLLRLGIKSFMLQLYKIDFPCRNPCILKNVCGLLQLGIKSFHSIGWED